MARASPIRDQGSADRRRKGTGMTEHAPHREPASIRRRTVFLATGLAAWIGSFLILWMLARFVSDDWIISLLLAGMALVTLSPLLGVLTRPRGMRVS
jgi:hypothetical protein